MNMDITHDIRKNVLSEVQLSLAKKMDYASWYSIPFQDKKTKEIYFLNYDEDAYYFSDTLKRSKCCRLYLSLKWTDDGINFINPNTGYSWVLLTTYYIHPNIQYKIPRTLHTNAYPKCPIPDWCKSEHVPTSCKSEHIHITNNGPCCNCGSCGWEGNIDNSTILESILKEVNKDNTIYSCSNGKKIWTCWWRGGLV